MQGDAKVKSPVKGNPKFKAKSPIVSSVITNNITKLATKGCWLIDSGASAHMTANRADFDTYKPLRNAHAYVANSQKCAILGDGFSATSHKGTRSCPKYIMCLIYRVG